MNKKNQKPSNSTNIYEDLSLLDFSRIDRVTRNTINTIKNKKPQSENTQNNSLDKVKKKIKKSNDQHDSDNHLKLYNINFLTNQQENNILNKSLNRIHKNFLPTYIKVIDSYVKIIMVQNTHLYTQKKTMTKDWIKECFGGKIQRKVPQSSKILGMQQICFQQINFPEFLNIFSDKIKQYNMKEKKNIYQGYKLQEKQKVIWPVMILQPLNFDHIVQIQDLVKNQVRDDQVKLPFVPIIKPDQIQIEQQTVEIIPEQGFNIQQDLLIWYIGTSVYKIVKISNLIHFNQISTQLLKKLFKQTHFKLIQQDIIEMIENYNSKIQKNNDVQLKAEDKKIFLRRIIKSKQNPNQLFILLRFKQNKQSKSILVRNLKTNQLLWTQIQGFRICYNLPQLTQQQLIYLYLLQKIDGQRQQIALDLILSNFWHRQINQQHIFRSFFQNKSVQQRPRCNECNYILHNLPYLQCFFCKKSYHKQCISQDQQQTFQFENGLNQYWSCKKCQFCKVCFSYIESDAITCFQCKKSFHKECGKTRQSFDTKYKYECQDCLKCDLCNRKSKQCTDGYVFVENNIYCNQCKILSNGQYCIVCRKAWNIQIKQTKAEWVMCICNGWVHKSCDDMLKKNYSYFQDQSAEYNCPKCRNIMKRKLLKQIIQILLKFDEYAYFLEPTYDLFSDYRQIISNPMCFKKMIEKCNQGLYDLQPKKLIIDDFNLIVSNALLYNMPKDHSHYCARILKLMGDLALDYLDKFFNIQDLELIQNKAINKQINQKQKQLYKYLYQHYLQIILNKNSTKSKVIIKMKNPVTQFPEILYFKSRQILNNFKNSQISIVYKKQPPKIQHLFSQPKTLQPIKLSITKPICYYHNDKNIISTCKICYQSYCCVKQCFLHQKCKQCGQKGCRCYSWECDCKAGYSQKDLQHPNLKPYNGNIQQITQMYKYCLKCSINNIKLRECKYCLKVCSFDYEVCSTGCMMRYHRNCMKKGYISNLCNDCEKLPKNEYKLSEMLKQYVKKKIYKIIRVDKFLPAVLNIFMQQKINLDPYHVKKIIFENYDKIQQYSQQIQSYITHYDKMSIHSIKQQKMKMTQLAVKQNLDQLKSQLTQYQKILYSQNFNLMIHLNHNVSINPNHKKLIKKYFNITNPYFYLYQLSEIINQYQVNQLILNDFNQSSQTNMQIQQQIDQSQYIFYKITTRRMELQIARTILSSKIKYNLLCQVYQFNSSFVFSSVSLYCMQNTYKYMMQLDRVIRNLFISFYNQYKLYPRVGSTCLIQLKNYDITVYKKWSKQKGVTIRLKKQTQKSWKLKIDQNQTIIYNFQQLVQALSRFRKFESLQEISHFLGFNIYSKRQSEHSYTKFLQTNLLDNDSFSDRKIKVLQFYDKVKNNVAQKKQLFFLKKKQLANQNLRQISSPPYITFEQLKKQIQDQPLAQKINLKIVEPNKQVFIAPSTIHKLGLFSKKFQPKYTILIQYIGQILSQPIADVRQTQFHLGCYMFGIPKKQQQSNKLNQDTIDQYTSHIHSKKDIIDATFRGNQARYLNHSCDPNCASRIEQQNGKPRILIYSIREIQAFQQLTYDYQFKVSADQKIICTCGAKNCPGRLN